MKSILIDCDCPDRTEMCKHVAAVLYGVGGQLDGQPELLFKVRGVDHEVASRRYWPLPPLNSIAPRPISSNSTTAPAANAAPSWPRRAAPCRAKQDARRASPPRTVPSRPTATGNFHRRSRI